MGETTVNVFEATRDIASFQKTLAGPKWLSALRSRALELFESSVWPTTSEEEWRRTSLRAFEFDSYQLGGADDGAMVPVRDEPDAGSADSETDGAAGRIVRRNGRLDQIWLADELGKRGVVCGSLQAIADSGENPARALRSTLERSLELADSKLQYWHFATFEDAAVIYVPRFVEIDQPIVVDEYVTGDEVLRTPHLIVILEEGARAKVIKRVSSAEEGEVFVVDADELIVNDAAALTFVTLQRTNDESLYFANSRGFVSRDGQIVRTEAALGADFVKTRYESELAGPGADAVLNGIYFGNEEEHLDLRTVQRHAAPRSTSRALYKGAVRGESHAIYQGLIQVSHEAVGTDAYLTNNNLILSEDARADSIPSLNISTDDVRCSHGSTTGKLDASQLYYLRTRGYTEEEARLTIVEGFFEGLVAQCPELVQDEIRELIAERLNADDE